MYKIAVYIGSELQRYESNVLPVVGDQFAPETLKDIGFYVDNIYIVRYRQLMCNASDRAIITLTPATFQDLKY